MAGAPPLGVDGEGEGEDGAWVPSTSGAAVVEGSLVDAAAEAEAEEDAVVSSSSKRTSNSNSSSSKSRRRRKAQASRPSAGKPARRQPKPTRKKLRPPGGAKGATAPRAAGEARSLLDRVRAALRVPAAKAGGPRRPLRLAAAPARVRVGVEALGLPLGVLPRLLARPPPRRPLVPGLGAGGGRRRGRNKASKDVAERGGDDPRVGCVFLFLGVCIQ